MSYFQNILFIADNCRILQFLDAKDGSALEKHVIRTIALNSEHSCSSVLSGERMRILQLWKESGRR